MELQVYEGIKRNDLFFLHDTKGIPLSIAIMLCKERGWYPNLAAFFFDAMAAGWNPDNALSTIEAACRDNEMQFNLDEFKFKAAVVWTKQKEWSKCSTEVKDE